MPREYIRADCGFGKPTVFHHVGQKKKKIGMTDAYHKHRSLGLDIREYKSGRLVRTHTGKRVTKTQRVGFGEVDNQHCKLLKLKLKGSCADGQIENPQRAKGETQCYKWGAKKGESILQGYFPGLDLKKQCGRAQNGKKEAVMLQDLQSLLKSDESHPILQDFKKLIGGNLDVVSVEIAGGCGLHYDMVFVLSNGERFRIEVKTSLKKKCGTNPLKPWEVAVQGFNGLGKNFPLAQKYADMWYDLYIKSGYVNREFGLSSEIPTKSVWLKTLAFKFDKKRGDWGGELYNVLKTNAEKQKLMNKVIKPQFTKVFNDYIRNNSDDDGMMKATRIAIKTMVEEKDAWLCISGDINGDYTYAWYPKLPNPNVVDMTPSDGGKDDVEIRIVSDNFPDLTMKIRWRNRIGMQNISCDLS